MKLRFRSNSLRLRVNQVEVEKLAAGETLTERVSFPGSVCFSYILKSNAAPEAASFADNSIEINVPKNLVGEWAQSDGIGLYFTLPTGSEPLRIAIEKDLACVDGPDDERDPKAFPRSLAEITAC